MSGGLSVCCFAIHEIAVPWCYSGVVGILTSAGTARWEREEARVKKNLYDGKQ